MGVLLKSIRKILVELIDRIDSGECATTDEQERMFLDLCTMIADKERRVSKYEACRYLNIPFVVPMEAGLMRSIHELPTIICGSVLSYYLKTVVENAASFLF